MTTSILKRKKIKLLPLFLLSYALSFSGITYAQKWSPAKFASKAQEILRRIDYSKRELEGLVVINSGALITLSGRLRDISIYSNPSQNSKFGFYERAVENALHGRNFEPARIDGKAKPVWVNFSVVFENTGQEKTVNVFPSLLAHADIYGTEYSDPQREITNLGYPGACLGLIGSMVWVATNIDPEGKASIPEIIAGKVTPQCKRAVIKRMNMSVYIPAILNGDPVKAKYVEVFYTHNHRR